MGKSIKYFINIIYLIPVFVFSQSFYHEVGLNSFNKIQYQSPDETESNSTSPRSRVEMGLMLSSSKKLMPYIGLSQEKFAFNIKHNQLNHQLKSLIETNYFGINFGANYLAYTKKNLKIFGSSGLSTNFLTGGGYDGSEFICWTIPELIQLQNIQELIQLQNIQVYNTDLLYSTRYYWSSTCNACDCDTKNYKILKGNGEEKCSSEYDENIYHVAVQKMKANKTDPTQ